MSAITAVRSREAEGIVLSTWGVFWRSRLLIWIAGCAAALLLGTSGNEWAVDPASVSSSFGGVGNVLLAPAVRWDSIWYLLIAHNGYAVNQAPAFYPVYPLLIRIVGWVTRSDVLAGVLISGASLFAGLAIVRRLTELELGQEAAGAAVLLLAFTPMAVFFSAVYTESLFLALSAAMFLAARRERWALAALLGALAGATRVTGVVLVIPYVLLFRESHAAHRRAGEAGPARWKLLWAALVPSGAVLYSAYLASRGFGWLAPMHAQRVYWGHHFTGPIVGVLDGVGAAGHQVWNLVSGVPLAPYGNQALLQLGVLVLICAILVGTVRRLPSAYAAYAVASLLMTLSSPTVGDPLRALDRYAAVLFPLYMTAGAWAAERGQTRKLVLVSALGLAFFATWFATWQFVA